jgi:NAD(P)-dependent dehydrogenase (short-subunit alcohol dehydrogenase family)
MLLALSMAEKLEKHGLLTFAVHPGVIFATNLGKHLDPAVDIPNLGKLRSN